MTEKRECNPLTTILKCRTLVWSIMSSHKGSIGSLENTYLPQLSRTMVDDLSRELGEVIANWQPKQPGYLGDVNGPGCDPDVR